MPYVFVHRCLLDISEQFRAVERSLDPEGPGKRPAADRLIETERGGVYIRAPAGQRTAWIREASTLDHHDAQQIALGRSLPASHAGSLRAGASVRPARHPQVYLPVPASPLRGNGRTLAGQKGSVDLRTVRRYTSPHVAGLGGLGRLWAERCRRRSTVAPGGRRTVSDGRMRYARRTTPRITVPTARGVRGAYGTYEGPRRTARASAPSTAPSPPSAPYGPVPRCVRRRPVPPRRQLRSPRGDRPAAAPLSCAPSPSPSPSVCSVSGRISMRQPVRRAARRAFCPSLPIASDSW